MKLFTKNAITAAVGLSLAGIAGAYDMQNNPPQRSIIWKYHDCVMDTTTGSTGDNGDAYFSYRQGGEIPLTGSASECYSAGFNTAKNPLTAPATLDTLSPKIAATLKESQHIDKSGIQLGEDDANNIYVAAGKEVEVWATFMDEGAGYENSVGFFTWSGSALNSVGSNKPTRHPDGYPMLADGSALNTERIFLPRTSTTFPLPRSTTTGTTVYLGKFNGGTHGLGIGFMIASNSWGGSNARTTTMSNKSGVNPNRDKSWIFYSVKGMNPECTLLAPAACNNRDKHTVMLFDETVNSTLGTHGYHRMVLGIEDIRRTEGDHDFNDVLMAIHVKEKDTGAFVNKDNIPGIGSASTTDTDKDGVIDALDEFPNDKDRAFSRYFPGKTTWGTLAYEDLWPQKGDYDFNDLLMRYKSREILNAKREVVDLELDLRLDAAGAGFRNGFAINLPGIRNSDIQTATLTGTRYDGTSSPAQAKNLLTEGLILANPLLSGVTGGQNGSVLEIFRNSRDLIHPDNGVLGGTNSPYNTTTCTGTAVGFRNTGKNCAIAPGAEFKLTVNFKKAISSFPAPPYDPFLFRDKVDAYNNNGNTVEVHLPGKGPTSRADRTLFGTQIDRTPTTTLPTTSVPGDTYLSNSKLPWALHVPVEWNYPYEKLDFTIAYPDVMTWAQTGGKSNTNWFSTPADGGAFTFKANAVNK